MRNSIKVQISNSMGFGNNAAWNMGNFGASSIAALQVAANFGNKNPYTGEVFKNAKGEEIFKGGSTEAQKVLQAYMQNAIAQNRSDKDITIDGTSKTAKPGEYYLSDGTIVTQDMYSAVSQMSNMANTQVSQMQGQCQAMQSQVENNISIWLDYQKEQLDMQQEWEMDLLAEEQNDYEMEKTCIEAEIEMVKERKQAIEQQLGEAIKDSAPKFGLA